MSFHSFGGGGGGGGTVTSVSVTTANGVSGSVADATTTPALTLTLGAITPSSVVATGSIRSNTSVILEETGAGTDTITIQAPASIASSFSLTLPDTDGDADQFLKTDGTGVLSWSTPAGTGDVSKVGTPANNQIGVWTGDGTIEGDASLTWDGTSFNIATAKNFQIAGATILADAAGTTTLSNIDAIDATTESTIEAAIDTLANLTSIQGKTVTLGGNFITSGASSLTLTTTGVTNVTLPTTGTLATLTGTETLTSKRVTQRVVSMADATSFTPTADTADQNTQTNTQAGGTLTANAPSGTPTDGQKHILRIKSTNVQTFAWGPIYRGSNTVVLPVATTGTSKTDYFGFIYNFADTRWDCVSASYGYT